MRFAFLAIVIAATGSLACASGNKSSEGPASPTPTAPESRQAKLCARKADIAEADPDPKYHEDPSKRRISIEVCMEKPIPDASLPCFEKCAAETNAVLADAKCEALCD
jgi:hypothetical protein